MGRKWVVLEVYWEGRFGSERLPVVKKLLKS